MQHSIAKHITLWFIIFIFLNVPSITHAQSNELSLVLQTGHTSAVTKVEIHPSAEFILSIDNKDNIVVWNYALHKQFSSFHISEKLNDACFINDSVLAAATLQGIEFWDFRSGTVIKKIETEGSCRQIAFRFNTLFANANKLMYQQGWEVTGFTTWNDQFITTFFLSDLQHHIGLQIEDNFKLFEFATQKEIAKIRSKHTIDASIHDEEKQFSIIDHHGTNQIFSFEKGLRKKADINNNRRLKKYTCVSLNDSLGVIGNENDALTIFNLKNGRIQKHFKNHDIAITSLSLSRNANLLAVGDASGKIKLYDFENQNVIHHFEGISANASSIHFLKDTCTVLIAYTNGDIKRWNLQTHEVSTLSYPKTWKDRLRNTEYKIYKLEDYTALAYRYKGQGLFKELKPKFYELDFKNDQKIKVSKSLLLQSVSDIKASESKGLVKYNKKQYSITSNLKPLNIPEGVEIISADRSPDGKFLLCGLNNGLLWLFEYKTGKQLLELYSPTANSFFYANSEKYYYASKTALPYVGVKHRGELLGFEQIDLKYNRPDKVLKALGKSDAELLDELAQVHKKRIEKLHLNEEQLSNLDQLPHLQTNLKDFPVKTKAKLIDVHFDFEGNKEVLKALHVLINGVAVFGREGVNIQGKAKLDKEIVLSHGNNHIQAYVENVLGLKSIRSEAYIQQNENYTPSLYVLSIGSGQFIESDFNLNFAAKDARDVANALKNSKAFDEVHISILDNNNVTRAKIENEIALLSKADVDDVILVFFAGHGVLDQEFNYYLSCYDMDFSQPSAKGINYDQLENSLGNLKCRNKVVLIDACHSGEVDKEEVVATQEIVMFDDDELQFRSGSEQGMKYEVKQNTLELSKMIFADLRQNSGVIVISSAGGTEYALEGNNWSNGVFTFALINGLKKKYADANGDKKVSISELKTYVAQKVPELTNGMQTPTSRIEILEKEIRIW